MPQITRHFLILTVLLVAVNCALGLGGSVRYHQFKTASQEGDAESWARASYNIVLDSLLPRGTVVREQFPKNVKWMVTVRILPPFEEPEYRLSMHKAYDGKVEMSVIVAKGTSVLSQLRILRKQNPSATLDKISGLISLDRWIVTQSEQPQLSVLANEFEAISLSPVLPDEFRVDETGYEFWSESLWGNRLNMTLGGPGSQAKKQPHPLLQWAEAVRKAADRKRPTRLRS